jgi:hypothetical protein
MFLYYALPLRNMDLSKKRNMIISFEVINEVCSSFKQTDGSQLSPQCQDQWPSRASG